MFPITGESWVNLRSAGGPMFMTFNLLVVVFVYFFVVVFFLL